MPLKRQPHEMVKHTQTIRRQKPTNCFSVFDHFVRMALKGLRSCKVCRDINYQPILKKYLMKLPKTMRLKRQICRRLWVMIITSYILEII